MIDCVLSNQIIAEAANGPITVAADEYLRKEKNILIIPVSRLIFYFIIS